MYFNWKVLQYNSETVQMESVTTALGGVLSWLCLFYSIAFKGLEHAIQQSIVNIACLMLAESECLILNCMSHPSGIAKRYWLEGRYSIPNKG
jgi:hypothetical protein